MIPVGNINTWLVFRGAMLVSPVKSGFFPDGKRVVRFQFSEIQIDRRSKETKLFGVARW